MENEYNAHVPFAQLAPEEQFIYRLAAQAAILHLHPCLEAIQVVVDESTIDRTWDEYQFTPADGVAFFGNSERLEPYLIHCAVKDPNFWCPRLAALRIPRRNRKRSD